jgi:hypothetical protein
MALAVCNTINALTDLQVQLMDLLNKKFYALRRLAQLLEQAADLTGFLPDITKLIPLSAIDLPLYESLRNACPFLNLPPASTSTVNESIGKLQRIVAQAYGQILALLNKNPLFRITDGLVAQMNAYQQKMNVAALSGSDFLACLQAACAVAEVAVDSFQNLSQYSVQDALAIAKNYSKNFVEGQGKFYSDAASAKLSDLDSAREGVKDLFDADVSGVTLAGNRVITSI